MKILALETSAAACSAALCQDGTLLAQSWQNSGLTHSRTLLPLVDSMLKNCGASLKEVEVIAVAAGPGSFTGLRIGVATAKGLAWPEDKPCAPCSTLESMAWPLAHLEGRVIVCAMDARRSQVYNALFLAAGEGLQRLTPDRAIGLDQLGEELKKVEKEKIVVGDGARLCYNTLTEQGITLKMAPEHLRMQSAWGVARAALELVRASAIDHFLINDFEMSAALLELLLELDPEDHLEGSELLAFDYLAMDEQELFDEVINDVSDKCASRELLLLWSAYRRDGRLPEGELKRFRTRFAPYFAEFTAAEHPADETYLRDIESERPSQAAQARELWLQTENLWTLWPGFVEALQRSRDGA